MSQFGDLLNLIHFGKNPYDGFPEGLWRGTWYNDPGAARQIFKDAIDRLNPRLIIEVGSFVGESAIFMANYIKARKMDCVILCVDTWYAGFDHWKGAREKIQNHCGRPDFFYKFMANVIANDCQRVILPLASDSLNGARILRWLGVRAQLIYVDASHEEGDALFDYEAYWTLLETGGGMLVDDLSGWFPGVVHDWTRFISQHGLKPLLAEGEKALVIKP